MNIECFNNHNKPYLRLVASLGLKKVGSRYVHRRKTVLNLGPLDAQTLRTAMGRTVGPKGWEVVREDFRCKSEVVTRIEKYHGLTRIEDQFREMKGTLETRPVYVRTPEHVRAHLMVCFIALTMLRLIQRKTKASVPRDPDVKWSYGIPGARVAAAPREWKVDELPGDYYRMQNVTEGEIGKIKSTVNPF